MWDLDKLHSSKQNLLAIYENPVDTVACSPNLRLFYVKKYYSLSSVRGEYEGRCDDTD